MKLVVVIKIVCWFQDLFESCEVSKDDSFITSVEVHKFSCFLT